MCAFARRLLIACPLMFGIATPALAVDNLLINPGFADTNIDGSYGDNWGAFGAADFGDLWTGNPHASLYGDTAGNVGGIYQTAIAGVEEQIYQFTLMNTRIESNWDADLIFGLEYYASDDATKLGETLEYIDAAARIANGQIDGNVFAIQGTAVAGTEYVRPIVRFENVNAGYSGQTDASSFVFSTFLSVAPHIGDEYLKNPGFDDLDGNGSFGDYWSSYGAADFNELFGPGNPHGSLYADQLGNFGGIYQQGILGTPDSVYQFTLSNVRLEADFDADLSFGLEYYADDDYTKLGETIEAIDTSFTGDGLIYTMIGTAPAGTVYVRPVVFFDNVQSAGTERSAFVFSASLTEPVPGGNMLLNPEFLDLDSDTNFGDYWGAYGAASFNDFWVGNPHASLFGNWYDNTGGVFQLGIPGLAGEAYQFDLLNTRIEENWDADLYFGLEFYAPDDATKLGESIVLIDTDTRLANSQIDGNVFSMQAVAPAGTMIVRPIVYFDNVNENYLDESQASSFVFNTHLRVAPAPGDEYLKNPVFLDINGDTNFGDYWGSFGNVGFNEFFGTGNPHASLFADDVANEGGFYQQAVLGTPDSRYQFDLVDVRIEENWDADLYFGLEYYGDEDFTKIGETIELIDTSVTGDGLSYSLTGTAVTGTVYVRPIVFFNNVGTTGGTQRNAFVFETALTELEFAAGDVNCDGSLNNFDIDPFVLGLTDPSGYATTYPDCDVMLADCNGDGSVNNFDIDPFVALLTGK